MNISNITIGLKGDDLLSIYNDFVSIKELKNRTFSVVLKAKIIYLVETFKNCVHVLQIIFCIKTFFNFITGEL